jgi:hypothetical protein
MEIHNSTRAFAGNLFGLNIAVRTLNNYNSLIIQNNLFEISSLLLINEGLPVIIGPDWKL